MESRLKRAFEAIDDPNARSWLLSNKKRRVADVYHTTYGTRIFVENGVLVEEEDNKPSRLFERLALSSSLDLPSDQSSGPPSSQSSDPPSSQSSGPPSSQSSDPPSDRSLESTDEYSRFVLDGRSTCFPLSPVHGYSEEELEREAYEQTTVAAEAGLLLYNKQHDVEYELVEPLCSNGFCGFGLWIHCNFKAAPKVSSHEGKPSSELFFAELKVTGNYGGDRYIATMCCSLEGLETVEECRACKRLVHPTCGYRGSLQAKDKTKHSL